VVTPNSQISASEENAHIALLPKGPRSRIVDALNLLGVTPSDLVAILEALKQAGSLKAEMVVI
jgi:flagellar P-ring protein precursor FlgI